MTSIAIYLLNVMISVGTVVRNIKGCTEYCAHCSQFFDIDSIICFAFWLNSPGNTLSRRFNSVLDEGCIK